MLISTMNFNQLSNNTRDHGFDAVLDNGPDDMLQKMNKYILDSFYANIEDILLQYSNIIYQSDIQRQNWSQWQLYEGIRDVEGLEETEEKFETKLAESEAQTLTKMACAAKACCQSQEETSIPKPSEIPPQAQRANSTADSDGSSIEKKNEEEYEFLVRELNLRWRYVFVVSYSQSCLSVNPTPSAKENQYIEVIDDIVLGIQQRNLEKPKKLHLYGGHFSNKTDLSYKILHHFNTIKELTITDVNIANIGNRENILDQICQNLKDLESLEIFGVHQTQEGLKFIVTKISQNLKSLKRLVLRFDLNSKVNFDKESVLVFADQISQNLKDLDCLMFDLSAQKGFFASEEVASVKTWFGHVHKGYFFGVYFN